LKQGFITPPNRNSRPNHNFPTVSTESTNSPTTNQARMGRRYDSRGRAERSPRKRGVTSRRAGTPAQITIFQPFPRNRPIYRRPTKPRMGRRYDSRGRAKRSPRKRGVTSRRVGTPAQITIFQPFPRNRPIHRRPTKPRMGRRYDSRGRAKRSPRKRGVTSRRAASAVRRPTPIKTVHRRRLRTDGGATGIHR
jgi:hypothetical protein